MRRFILAGLAVLLCAGLASAWFVLGDWNATDTDGGRIADSNANLDKADNPLDPVSPESAETAKSSDTEAGRSLGSPTTAPEGESGSSGEATRENPRGNPTNPGSNTTSPDDPNGTPAGEVRGGDTPESSPPPPGTPSGPPEPEVIPRSARDPTARERVARSRYGRGKLPRASEIPEAVEEGEKPPLDLTKLAEPEIWAEYWAREGYTPPAMVKTPVRGKVMSLLTNTQVPLAKVRVFTFFPATSRLNGPVLPVIMEAATDDKGFFEANLPAPSAWPSDYPRYALSIEWEGKRLVDCAPFENLRAGEDNEIGVFWAPEEPYEVEVSVTTAETGLAVAATGRIDPRRWETTRAARIFESLSMTPVGTTAAKLTGTWDFLKADNLPYLTLLRSGQPILTRQCVIHPDERVRVVLDTTTTALFFEEAPLDDVLYRLRDRSGLQITHTNAIYGDTPLSLDTHSMTIREALELVTELLDAVWRIENGGVVIDEATDSNPPETTPPSFLPVVFPNNGNLILSGNVVDKKNQPVEGAVLILVVDGEDVISYSDSTGWFTFGGLPNQQLNLTATHESWVDVDAKVQPGVTDRQIQFYYRRPKMTLTILRDADGSPVKEVWFHYQAWEFNIPIVDEPPPMQVRRMTSANGIYLFENQKPLVSLTACAPGLTPLEIDDEDPLATLEVRMSEGLLLDRRPRDYDAAQSPNLFNTDDGDGPGLWSLDDDHWVEYTFDFGEDEQDFDLVLGVTNHTYATLPLDNEYLFNVRVYVDGKSVGTMHIASDPDVAQIGRISLGKLTGAHTVRIMWLNDRYIPGQLDANIRYESLRLMETP